MKKNIILASMVLAAGSFLFSSCEDMFGDYLDKEPSNTLTKDDVLKDWTNLEEHHFDTYNFLRHGACRINYSWLDAATDLAETSYGTGGVRTTFNIGNYYGSGGADELTGTWESRYRGIRKCNQTIVSLEQAEDSTLKPTDLTWDTYYARKTYYISEAKFLRAYFHWELFLRYGPVPYVTKVLDPDGDLLTDYKDRPSLKVFMDSLINDVETSEAGLMTYEQMNASKTEYAGRVCQPVAAAFYSRIMLYLASPRYSSESGVTWEQAAEAAKAFLDKYGSDYSLETRTTGGVSAYSNAWMLNTYNDNNPEVIWFRNDTPVGWSAISHDSPVGEGGYGGCCPSQNLVDMYDMADGSAPFSGYDATGAPVYTDGEPTVNSASGYSDQTMWENRDPRLASTVLYNGMTWNSRTINVVYGQADNPVGNSNSTKTGYYLKKYIPETILNNNHAGTARRLWKIFGYNEILLNYAEALNEVDFAGNYEEICSLLDQIRHRAGITGNVADRIDLDNQEAMRNFIHKERTIELCFEEHRWWDVRRWNVAGDALGRDIYGIDVASDGTITRKVAQSRVWQDRFYLYPIPESEVWKIGEDFQNEGW
jgi:hypothetical protein